MNLLQTLIQRNIISKEEASQLEAELRSSEKKIEEMILERKMVDEEMLFAIKSEASGTPLAQVDIDEIPLKVLEFIPEDSAKYYHMVPLAVSADKVEVGMVYPENLQAHQALRFLARQQNFTYQVFLISLTTFGRLLKQYRNLKGEVDRKS